VIITLIGLDIVIWEKTKYFLIDEIKEELSLNVNLARKIISPESFFEKNKEELKIFSNSIRKATGLRTTIISKDGEVLADSEIDISELPNVENHINREEVQSSLETGNGFSRRHSATINTDLLYYCENYYKDNRVVGFIRFAMFATKLDTKMDFLSKLILLIDVSIFVLMSLFLFFYSKYLQNRINAFIQDLESVKEKEVFTEIDPQKYFEFDLIAGNINSIGNYYQKKYCDIKTDNIELHRIFNAMKEGIAAFDKDGKILFHNTAFKRVLNITGEIKQLIPFYDLIHFPPIINDINDFLNNKSPLSNRTKYPGQVYIDYIITPLLLDSNEYHGFIISIEDVTSLHNLEVMRKDFVANISHEFKTPLTSIKGYTETLLSGTVDDKVTQDKFLNKILNQSNHLGNIFADLLLLSRIENRESLELERIDPAPHIENLTKNFHQEAEAKNITLIFQHKLEKDFTIKVDSQLFDIMVSNLIINAIKYSQNDGVVEIILSEVDDQLNIVVVDSGIGIPEKEQTRVFERFYRTEISRELNPQGSGLGLSIVKNIVELFKGSMQVKSKKKEGSKFTISLPKAD